MTNILPKILLKQKEELTNDSSTLLGTIVLLPTGAESHFFSVNESSLTIGSKFEARKQHISVRYEKWAELSSYNFEVLPHVFKTCHSLIPRSCARYECQCYTSSASKKHSDLCNCSECQFNKTKLNNKELMSSSIFCINSSSKRGCSYKLSNVHGDGKICYGDAGNYPKTPRQAYASFWAAPFTAELGLLNGHIEYHKGCSNRKLHSRIHCRPHGSERFCRKQVVYTCNCPFKEFDIHDGCYSCSTGCNCECCLGKCFCTCKCNCCLNICKCRCECANDIVFDKIKNFKLDNENTSFLDYEFVAGVEAVFISQNSYVISQIPEKAKFFAHYVPCVVGFASRDNKNNWLVDVTGNIDDVLYFSPNQIKIF